MNPANERTMLGRDESQGAKDTRAASTSGAPFQTAIEGTTQTPAWLEMQDGVRFEVGVDCSLGRSRSNNIVLPNEKVSRCHAQIQLQEPSMFWLSDLGSSNGTWLNGRRITAPATLCDQDNVQIGPFALLFRYPSGPARPRTPLTPRGGSERRSVICWLLLPSHGSAAATGLAKPSDTDVSLRAKWLDGCQQIIEERGGCVSKYFDAGFLAVWQDRSGMHSAVARAVMEITRLQTNLRTGNRFVLHYGSASLGGTALFGSGGVSGPAVSFLFRMDRLAESLKRPLLISEDARKALGDELVFSAAGKHAVNGFEGEFSFFVV